MSDGLKNIPDINEYRDILKASHSGRLVVFLGSGVSALLGYRNWKEYADAKAEWLFKKRYINFHDKEKLRRLDAKKILSICDIIFQEKGITCSEYNEKDFLFQASNEHKCDNDEVQIYKDLYEFKAVYITTNYDDCLDKIANGSGDIEIDGKIIENGEASQPKVFFLDDDFTSPKLTLPGNVFHIHGSVNSAESMVITGLDYIKRYARDTKLESFLTSIFQEYTVLFIGYGLEEIEILDFIVSTGRRKNSDIGNVIKHYALFPTFLDEETMFGFYDKFYNKLGIKLIPYYKDECGYAILKDIIKRWSEVIRNVAKEISLSDKIAFVDECLLLSWKNLGIKKDELRELMILKGNEDVRGYFFKKLNDEKWFDYLNEAEFFRLTTDFEPVLKKDNEKVWITMPFWDEITYICRISEKIRNEEIKSPDKEKYVKDFIEFISNVDDFANVNQIRNNSTIAYNLIKIFVNLPYSSYEKSFLKHIEKWIYTKYDSTTVLSELTKDYIPNLLTDDNDKEAILKVLELLDYILKLQFEQNNGSNNLNNKRYWINKFFEGNSEILAKKCQIEISRILIDCTLTQIRQNELTSYIEFGESKLEITAILCDKNNYDVYISSGEKKVNAIKFDADSITYDEFEKNICGNITKYFDADFRIVDNSNEIWNFFWMIFSKEAGESIYDLDDRSEYRFDNYQHIIYWLRSILLFASNNKLPKIEDLIRYLLNSNYMLLKKVGLVVIAESDNEKLTDVFFEIIKTQYSGMVFNGIYTADELKHLLNKLNNITDENKVFIKDIIEKGPFNYWTNEKEEILRWKQERYNALSHIFTKEYEDIIKETGKSNIALHPGIGKLRITTGWGGSPLTENEILEISNQTLVNAIKDFVPGDSWNDEPTVNGFAATLGSAIKNNPRKFFNDLELFYGLEYIYTYEILSGLNEYIKNDDNMSFYWEDVLVYIKKIIDDQAFWENKYVSYQEKDRMSADFQWVLTGIFELLREGIGCNNSHNLGSMHYDEAFAILKEAVSKLIDKEIIDEKVYNVENMINDTLGKGLMATFELYYFKSKKIDNDMSKWSDLKNIYEVCLNNGLGKMYTFLGYYLVYIYDVDNDWAKEIVEKSYNAAADYLRDSFMFGYMARHDIYWNTYAIMNKFYEKYLTYPFDVDKHYRELLVQHITIGYFDNKSNEEGELFNKLLASADADALNEIIDFIYSKDKVDQNACNLVLKFWNRLCDIIIKDASLLNDKEKILANTVKMGKFIGIINAETFALLLEGAKGSQKEYTAWILLEELVRFIKGKDNNPWYIAKIFEAMCNGDFHLLDYEDEKLKTVYKFLIEQNDQDIIDIAKDINDTYLSKNNEIFKELWGNRKELEV